MTNAEHPHRDDPSASSEQTPRWVRVTALAALVLLAVVVVVHLAGGGAGSHG